MLLLLAGVNIRRLDIAVGIGTMRQRVPETFNIRRQLHRQQADVFQSRQTVRGSVTTASGQLGSPALNFYLIVDNRESRSHPSPRWSRTDLNSGEWLKTRSGCRASTSSPNGKSDGPELPNRIHNMSASCGKVGCERGEA